MEGVFQKQRQRRILQDYRGVRLRAPVLTVWTHLPRCVIGGVRVMKRLLVAVLVATCAVGTTARADLYRD